MNKVYSLKHATPRMKYLHMNMVMDFKAKLNEIPTSREEALSEIKNILGSEKFGFWYNEIYKLRQAGKREEYEKAIFTKLAELKKN